MAEPEIPIWSNDEVSTQLAVVLETWPLYRRLVYKNANVHDLPKRISHYCDHRLCKTVQQWSVESPTPKRVVAPPPTPDLQRQVKVYNCPNCRVRSVKYFYWWFVDPTDGIATFKKIGEYPPPTERIPDALEKNLDEQDIDFYKKAVRLRNHNLGIAAVAYLRRVIENRINDMLDVLAEAAKEYSFAEKELKKITAIKAAHRLDDKIDYAAALLPPNLRPKNLPNPIDKLHELASDGLHARSEEECVDIFDRCKAVFEYVFGTMNVQVSAAQEFVKNLEKLSTGDAGEKEKE